MADKPKPHVSKYKERIVAQFVKLIKEYPIVGAVNMEGMPAPQLQVMKGQLRGSVVILMNKRRLIKIAIDQCKDKKGLDKLKEHLGGMPALLFTKENPFKLYKIINKSKSPAPAKPGQKAPRDIVVPAGPTPFAPGPVIGELGAVGIKTEVVDAKIAVKEDSVVAKEGDEISMDLAAILTRLGITPMEIGLDLVAVYEDGVIYDKKVLDIDEDEFMNNLQNSAVWAVNLAVEVGHYTKETIDILLPKAFREAKAVSVEGGILNDSTRDELLSKAAAQANALKSEAKIEDAPAKAEAPKVEEKKEEPKAEEKPVEAPKEEPKVEEKAPEPVKEEPKKEEPKPEPVKEEVKVEEKAPEPVKEEPKVEEKPKEKPKPEPIEPEVTKEEPKYVNEKREAEETVEEIKEKSEEIKEDVQRIEKEVEEIKEDPTIKEVEKIEEEVKEVEEDIKEVKELEEPIEEEPMKVTKAEEKPAEAPTERVIDEKKKQEAEIGEKLYQELQKKKIAGEELTLRPEDSKPEEKREVKETAQQDSEKLFAELKKTGTLRNVETTAEKPKAPESPEEIIAQAQAKMKNKDEVPSTHELLKRKLEKEKK